MPFNNSFTDAKSYDNALLKLKDVLRNAKRFQDSLRAFSNKRSYDLKRLAPAADGDDKPANAIERDAAKPQPYSGGHPIAYDNDIERDADAAKNKPSDDNAEKYYPRGPPPVWYA